jgi:hypothetical protein
MRGFLTREIKAAIGHSLAGGQALHLHTLGAGKGAPAVFLAAVRSGNWIAHLFDQDAGRLERTARALGVSHVAIDRRGEPAQHIDLCHGPLWRAMAACENVADLPERPPGAKPPAGPTLLDRPIVTTDKLPPAGEIRFGNLPPLPPNWYSNGARQDE